MGTPQREILLRDAMRLEDKAPDGSKGLWLASYRRTKFDGTSWEEIIILEALTAPGARAILETLDLLPEGADLGFVGPVNRKAWPRDLIPWYEWLDEDDPRLVAFFDVASIGAAQQKSDTPTRGSEDPA